MQNLAETGKMNPAEEHYSYGQVYFDQQDFDRALEEFRLALELAPENSSALISLGRCYLVKKELDLAVLCFEKAVRITPHYADGHFYLGQTYLELDRRDNAIDEFKEALNINPRYKAAKSILSRLLQSEQAKGDDDHGGAEAKEEARRARQTNIHFHLGNALLQKNLLQEALSEYKAAVLLKPNYPDIHNKLGELYMKRGFYNLAQEEFKLALKLNPRFENALLHLGEACMLHAQQLVELAGETYERATQLSPENPKALEGLERIAAFKQPGSV